MLPRGHPLDRETRPLDVSPSPAHSRGPGTAVPARTVPNGKAAQLKPVDGFPETSTRTTRRPSRSPCRRHCTPQDRRFPPRRRHCTPQDRRFPPETAALHHRHPRRFPDLRGCCACGHAAAGRRTAAGHGRTTGRGAWRPQGLEAAGLLRRASGDGPPRRPG